MRNIHLFVILSIFLFGNVFASAEKLDSIVTIICEYLTSRFAVDFIIFISNSVKNAIELSQNKRKRLAEYNEKGIKYIVEYPYDTIIQPNLIYNLILSHRQKCYDVSILQMSGYFVDKLMTQMFHKLKDIELFYGNIGKLTPLRDSSYHSLKCFSMNYYMEQYLSNQHVVYSSKK